jgi:group I intron endonuclease
MSNFSLVILEYTSSEDLIACEQKWIDLLKPDYNTNPIAGSSKGYKHSEESIEKIRKALLGKKRSEEVKLAMSESRKGENNSFYGKKHTKEAISLLKAAYANREKSPVQPPVGIEVEITDLETKITTTYESIRKAAKAIGSDIKSISRREKSQLEKGINTPYRNRYMIVIRRS